TALSEPVSRSSLWLGPGSRKCTCVSITPGRMCRPLQSITSAAEACPSPPIAAMRPWLTAMSRTPSPSWLTTVPDLRITSKLWLIIPHIQGNPHAEEPRTGRLEADALVAVVHPLRRSLSPAPQDEAV